MKQIEELFQEFQRNHRFSGTGLIKQGGNTLFEGAYGLAHKGFNVPNQIDTRFDTASITKLFTAVAVLQLVEQGKLGLDDAIVDRVKLSGTAIPDDVTIRHLLTHTSGIADDADEELGESYEELFLAKPNYSIRECIDFLPQFAYKEPKFKAGTDISYNNCAFVLLGLAIEQATGGAYRDYVTRQIFQPAGMTGTAFFSKDEGDAAIAEGYDAVENEDGTFAWRKNIYSYPPIGTSDGGAFTTVRDLDRFMHAVAGGKLLSPALTKDIMEPQTALVRTYGWGSMINGYGFHFCYDDDGKLLRMFKDGSNAGVAAMLAFYPESDMTIALLANQTCDVWKLHRLLEKLVQAER